MLAAIQFDVRVPRNEQPRPQAGKRDIKKDVSRGQVLPSQPAGARLTAERAQDSGLLSGIEGMVMRETKKLGTRLVDGVSKRLLHARKYLYQSVKPVGSQQPRQIVFIFGCQRSGTTLMQQIFDKDFHAKVYGEFDKRLHGEYREAGRSASGKHFRLKPLEEVKAVMDRDRASLIVAKPLVETQNALKILAFFPGSKALFMYRNYAAVASSNLKRFGRMNGINNLWPIVNGAMPNWRAEGVPPEIRSIVAARFREDMNPYDAAALFWYVRNRFFFDLQLDRHPAVKLCSYEHLVRDPCGMIGRIYRFLDMEPPRAASPLVRRESSGRSKEIELSPDIDRLCRGLLERLDSAASGEAFDARVAA